MITFENIRTGEKVTFTGEEEALSRNAHMAAYLNASDLSPNAGQRGQDFGWRLAPEVIAQMEAIRQDYEELDKICRRVGIGMDDVKDFHILSYVADKSFAEDARKAAVKADTTDIEEDYRARVKAAKQGLTTYVEEATEVKPEVLAEVKVPKVSDKIEVQSTKKEK